MPTISLVIPCHNEADVLPAFYSEVTSTISKLPDFEFEFVFVDDGSEDETLARLLEFKSRDPRVSVVELSRNFGKEPALSAGLEAAGGDAVIPIDADLQDPPELILPMVEAWRSGAEVVLARRSNRDTDSFLKRWTAECFYKIHNSIADVRIPRNVGDFRLMDRQVVDAVKQLPERMRFMKGIFAWVGFDAVYVDYAREPRAAGESSFSGVRLWNFALEGITSFSTIPLRVWTYFGAFIALVSFVYGAAIAISVLIFGVDVPGYASIFVAVSFLGSVNLIGIGILGEYLGRTYLETKMRPLYFVKKHHRASVSEHADG